jgi:hypothetical protein
MNPRRTVFYISDRTGITVETLGKTLLTQFPSVTFEKHVLPFVDTTEKAHAALTEINHTAERDGTRPIVFSTLIDDDLRRLIAGSEGFFLDLFEGFIGKLQSEFKLEASHAVGLSHGMGSANAYEARMSAVNYTLMHDDGVTTENYHDADIVLVGVSRTGKTPTCLYLAMQHGLRAANYPLTPEDLMASALPKSLTAYRSKLFGLTLEPERLAAIRAARKPGSRYAALDTCRQEISRALELLQNERVPILDTTRLSVEEIAVTLLHRTGLSSRVT